MELLATIGVAAKELFEYNREMYQFDQEQRLDRDLLRLEMQVKRFSLFREDIRDLVELTVGKMEMYHAVGALSLWFCITWYTEGRIRAPEAPPFILSLYWMSIAGAFVYLLLTVWLSMHASVTSHSIGVRLLTRYVRLPIPGSQQLNALNPRLADFEGQGARNMLRVPFLRGPQEWLHRARGLATVREREEREDGTGGAEHEREHNRNYKPFLQSGGRLQMQDLLDRGEVPLHKESELHKAAKRMPGKHVQLFRQLQAKWQCYDAYARVCMSLGMNQVLMSACFYLICATLLEYHSPSLCFALIAIFQSCSLAMSFLDVSGVGRGVLFLLWFFGSLSPIVFAAVEVTLARGEHEAEKHRGADIYENKHYRLASVPFFLIAGWMLGLLRLAWPSHDERTLPRLFRSVLFVDVFALEDDANSAIGRRDGSSDHATRTTATTTMSSVASTADPHLTQERAAAADEACYVAEAGLRRWEAVPAGTSEASTQGAEVARLRRDLNVWRRALNSEAARIAGTHGDMEAVGLLEVDRRAWHELSAEEQAQDPWAQTLLGPFEHNTLASHYYYDLEAKQFVWEAPEGRDVLTLEELQAHVQEAEDQVRAVFKGDPELASRAAQTPGADSEDEICVDRNTCCCCRVSNGKAAFVPERLPWFSLSWMTWTLVLAWICEGSFLLLEQFDLINVDTPKVDNNGWDFEERKNDTEEVLLGAGPRGHQHEPHRRLGRVHSVFRWLPGAGAGAPARTKADNSASAGWSFTTLDVAWPSRLLFQPDSVACLPEPGGALLLGSREGLHWAPMPRARSSVALQLTPLPLSSPRRGTALCGPPMPLAPAVEEREGAPCLMASPTTDGVVLWRERSDGTRQDAALPLSGLPWRCLTGAVVQCSELRDLLLDEPQPRSWCLLLVGWDGQRLPVAALPLPDGPLAPPPPLGEVAPSFAVPLDSRGAGSGSKEILNLHLEPRRLRLWALRADGQLDAWDLRRPHPLGSWRPQWIHVSSTGGGAGADMGSFRPLALCEDRLHSRLFVLGRHGLAGPQLLWAQLPGSLDAL